MRLAWSAIVLVACGGAPADEPDGAPPPPIADLVLGTASADRMDYMGVEDGDDVPLIPGSQGGFHVWTGLRLRGATGTLHLEREARRVSDGKLVLRASTVVMEVPVDAMDQWWERPHGEPGDALPSFMCPTPIGVGVRDEPLVLRAQILSQDDELLAEDALTFVPRCPEGDQAAFCADICSG